MRAPVAANGWPKARLEPLTLSLARSIEPSGSSRPRILLAVGRVLPRLQRRQHLRGERLVDLVEVEVLQFEPRALEHARDRDGRRHQQALARDEVVGRGLRVGEVGLHRQTALGRPLLRGEQHGRRAVGERRGVGRGQRAALDLSNAGFRVAIFSRLMSSRRLLSRNTPANGTTRSSM